MKKRLMSLLLVLVLILSIAPTGAMAASPVPTEAQAYTAMMALKDDYPEGMRWTNDNFYEWNGGIYYGGYGCAGFAFLLSDAAFGDLPARIIEDITIADVHVGDILRVNGDTHSVIITEVHSDYVILAEGNYNSSIHWGRRMTSTQVAASDFMITRYPVGTFGQTYIITYDANGGSGAPDAQLADNMGTTVSTTVPVRKGYAMLGWALSASAASPDYLPGDKITVKGNTTLYAVWKESIQRISAPYPAAYTAAVPAGGEVYYSITPGADGDYIFESAGSQDTYITLYDASWNTLKYDDDGGEGNNFRLSAELKAGTTYYVGVKLWSGYASADVPFTVSRGTSAHNHSYTASSIVPPTCTEQGYTVYSCSCGEYYFSDYEDALGHSYGAWTVTAKPTCTEKGEETRSCARCGEIDTREVSASGHNYSASVTAPTCTEQGYTTHTCTVCKASYVDAYVKALGHSYSEGVCTRCGAEDPGCSVQPDNPFVDVVEDDYFCTPVLWAFYHEPQITNGMDKTHFAPNSTCTRAQVVTFLWRAMGCPTVENAKNPFDDVKSGQWYTDAVLWAVENGITNGTSATTFSPNAKVTRAQTVTFLYRAAKGEPVDASNPFKDVAAGQYYSDAVMWAVANGITNGTSPTTFYPDKTCTRGQIVTFLYRFMGE